MQHASYQDLPIIKALSSVQNSLNLTYDSIERHSSNTELEPALQKVLETIEQLKNVEQVIKSYPITVSIQSKLSPDEPKELVNTRNDGEGGVYLETDQGLICYNIEQDFAFWMFKSIVIEKVVFD